MPDIADILGVDIANIAALTGRALAGGDLINGQTIPGGGVTPLVESVEYFAKLLPNGDGNLDQTISSVDTSRTVVIPLGISLSTSGQTISASSTLAALTLSSATTVTVQRQGSSSDLTAHGVVVQFKADVIQSIQTGSINITNAGASNTATISSVDTNNAFVIFGGQRNDQGSNARFATVALTNSSTVTAAVSTAPTAGNNIFVNYTVIEFVPGVVNSIQPVSANASNANASYTATISSVDTSNTVLFWGGWTTTYVTDNIPGNVFHTAELTNSTTITFTRTGTASVDRTHNVTAVEFASGVLNSRQQGAVSIGTSSASGSESVSSVNASVSFLTFLGQTTSDTSGTQARDSMYGLNLASATSVSATRGNAGTPTGLVSFNLAESSV